MTDSWSLKWLQAGGDSLSLLNHSDGFQGQPDNNSPFMTGVKNRLKAADPRPPLKANPLYNWQTVKGCGHFTAKCLNWIFLFSLPTHLFMAPLFDFDLNHKKNTSFFEK